MSALPSPGSRDQKDFTLQPTAPLRLRLTIIVALLGSTAIVAAGVARLDDRGEVTTGLIASGPPMVGSPAVTEVSTIAEPAVPDGPARVAVVPDKDAAVAEQWEAAGAAAVELAEAEAARRAATTTVPPTTAETTTTSPPAPRAQPPEPVRPAPTTTSPPPPSPPSTSPPSPGGSLNEKLDNIARCESGMNPRAYNAAGPYLGAFQFHLSTWRGLGESGDPRDRSYTYQRRVAARLQQRSGWGSWPHCAAELGYL